MENQRKQILLRVLAGIVLILLAGFITVFIRDVLAYNYPESTLPTMDVYYKGLENGERLPAMHIRRDRYTWRFLVGTQKWENADIEVWREIEPAWVAPNADLDIVFSFPEEEMTVSMASGDSGVFVEIGGQLKAPEAAGVYTYRVQGGWGNYQTVQFYFRIRVPEW